MNLLKLVIVAAGTLAVVKGAQQLGRHCRRTFGHSIFSMRGFWLAAITINLVGGDITLGRLPRYVIRRRTEELLWWRWASLGS
ncbi:hypothetical protein [Paraburkholderia phenoliruptrix]|uniref:hypothetical protein n=1 Tax=Paraburkholderia phenoliruptrix TaxID=252970 RepID=UPI0032079C33